MADLESDLPFDATPAAKRRAPRARAEGWDERKAPDALRTIGEVAAALGIRQHVLRYWEDQFPMLRPLTRSGGRRYYRPEDIALLRQIDRLVHHEGYTLRGARGVIEGEARQAPPPAPQEAPAVAPAVAIVFRETTDAAAGTKPDGATADRLRAIRDRLAAALAS